MNIDTNIEKVQNHGRAALPTPKDLETSLTAEKLEVLARRRRLANPDELAAVLERFGFVERTQQEVEKLNLKNIDQLQNALAGYLAENEALTAALIQANPSHPLAHGVRLKTRIRQAGRQAFNKNLDWEAAKLVGRSVDLHLP